MAKKRTKKARNTTSPATPTDKSRRRNWDHGRTIVPVLLEDGSSLPSGISCSMTGGPHGPLELTPDNDRWPVVGDIPPTAVMPDLAS